MEVSVTPLTDIELVRTLCGATSGKESKITIEKIVTMGHSPMRGLIYLVEMIDIPTFVSVHLVRHKIGVEHFVRSNREDRGGDVTANRHTPVTHLMLINAEALITMSHRRLCYKAHEETRQVMEMIQSAFFAREDDHTAVGFAMEPMCRFRGGQCPEAKPCGKYPVVSLVAMNDPINTCLHCNQVQKEEPNVEQHTAVQAAA